MRDLTPPANIKLTQSGRSRLKCETCADVLGCDMTRCTGHVPILGYYGAIQFDVECAKPDLKRNR